MHLLSVTGQCVHSKDHGVEKEVETIADWQLDLSRFTHQNEVFKSSISGQENQPKCSFLGPRLSGRFKVNTVVYYTTPVYIHKQMQRAPLWIFFAHAKETVAITWAHVSEITQHRCEIQKQKLWMKGTGVGIMGCVWLFSAAAITRVMWLTFKNNSTSYTSRVPSSPQVRGCPLLDAPLKH